MSTNARRTENDSGNDLRPTRQPDTRCRILGIDEEGFEHVYDTDRNRIVVLGASGIDVQYDLDQLDQDARDWMHYVANERGWAKEQWTGYRFAEALAGAVREGL